MIRVFLIGRAIGRKGMGEQLQEALTPQWTDLPLADQKKNASAVNIHANARFSPVSSIKRK